MKIPLLTSLLLPTLVACTNGPIAKAILDEEVDRLCAIDGGTKVHRIIKLPPEKFNKRGQIEFFIPDRGLMKINSEYYYTSEYTYYKKGNPELWRGHYKLYKTQNDVLLGESIVYARRGGDAPGPWHESSYLCPPGAGDVDIEKHVFVPNTGE